MHTPSPANYAHLVLITRMTFRERLQVDKAFIALCLFPAPLLRAVPQHRIVKHFQLVLLPFCKGPGFAPLQTMDRISSAHISSFTFLHSRLDKLCKYQVLKVNTREDVGSVVVVVKKWTAMV